MTNGKQGSEVGFVFKRDGKRKTKKSQPTSLTRTLQNENVWNALVLHFTNIK